MKMYILSLAVGLLVGALYALLGVRAPAPPVAALLGLLGIYCGEQAAWVLLRQARYTAPTVEIAEPEPEIAHTPHGTKHTAPETKRYD